MKDSDFFSMGTIYYEMAIFLKKEGKKDNGTRRLGYEMKLRAQNSNLNNYLKSNVVKGVEILATNDSCDLCKSLSGKVFTIADAILTKPIPVEQCAHKYGCRCTYNSVIKNLENLF